jgi:hypothetical protein
MNEKQRTRLKIVETLECMLAGELSFIEGSRALSSLLHFADVDRMSEPFVTFVAIDSETDDMPLGDVKALWSKEALDNHAAEWRQAEDWARRIGEPASRDALALLR